MNKKLNKSCHRKRDLPKLFFICIFLTSFHLSAKEPIFAVVADDASPLYKRVISGFNLESRISFVEFSLDGDETKANEIIKQAIALDPKKIIAIGPKSANAVKRATQTIPVIYCMVPKLENYDLKQANILGIRLELPYEKQLQTLKTLFPKVTKIGVLYNPIHSKNTVESAKKLAQKNGLELIGIEISQPNDAKKAFAELKTPIEALWMISDTTALHINAWDFSKQYCLENKIPFFALDDGFVAKGALMAFATDYVWIGKQAASLANPENFLIKELSVLEPEGLDLAINISTAEQLGIASELSVRLIKYAADHQHSIQSFR